mmetsp:Transcript_16273/g.50953  ORF Transcript_16273/g.50953 Transcript_16273/m.50953 type:complete len:282 (-) Transcript_16273:79-924(-)
MDPSLIADLDATISQLQKKIASRQISSGVKVTLRSAAATGHALRQAAARAQGSETQSRKRKGRRSESDAGVENEPVSVDTLTTQIRAFLEGQRSGKRRRPASAGPSSGSRRGLRPSSQSQSTASVTESAVLPLPKVAVPLRQCPLSPAVHDALVSADIAAASHFLAKPMEELSRSPEGRVVRAAAAIGCPRVVGLVYPVDLLLPPTYPAASSPQLLRVVCHVPTHADACDDAQNRLQKAIADRERACKRYLRLEEVLELWSRACRIQPVLEDSGVQVRHVT